MIDSDRSARVRFHLRFGWWSLLVFLTLGVALESMHGFKIGWYLDVENEVRRLVFRLAHAHGALLGLVHVAFAATLHAVDVDPTRASWATRGFVLASVLLPAGFFLGGFGIHGGDPGPGIALVPLGAAALFVAVASTGWSLRGDRS